MSPIIKLGHTAPYLQSYGPLFIFFVRAITSTVSGLDSQDFMDIIHPDMAECRVIKFGHAAHDLQSYGPLIIFFARAITSTVSDLGS